MKEYRLLSRLCIGVVQTDSWRPRQLNFNSAIYFSFLETNSWTHLEIYNKK